ncbi:hypothetical protein NA57DRAFT_75739 [Rhizodiscina lignyota]|uniref:Uncharacterized protein n=1 Tax=Rhizodiscina lignyota TaxID=1504668 RepID=A0A9P4IF40_9PEZI|nr:hypothetical protein NA57DRAFT_75739 [Rhizodiscina lignyota]
MRIDTHSNEREHDVRSLLSAGSFEEICGASPSSYVNLNFDDLDLTPNSSDIMRDWQLIPSSPHSPYNNPRSVSGESSHSRHDATQRAPRTFSIQSSMSSAVHSGGQMLSPFTSSPEDRFTSHTLFTVPPAQPSSMDQQTLADMFAFTTAQVQLQPLNTTAPAYPSTAPRHAGPRYPSQMGYNVSNDTLSLQDSWAGQASRAPFSADAGALLFAPEYPSFDNPFAHYAAQPSTGPVGTEQSISPGTRDSPMNQPQWPVPVPSYAGSFADEQPSYNPDLLTIHTGGFELERTMSFPRSLGSSDIGPSRPHADPSDDVGTAHRLPQKSITPPVVIKQEEAPATTISRNRQYRFEPYAPSATAPTPSRPHGPQRPPQNRRVGGRQLGHKFDSEKANKIKERREDGACWVCSLQRDECSGGDICQRCHRRSSRPHADVTLGCDRTKLQDLKDIFVPKIITAMYEKKAVEDFARAHIGYWHKKAIIVPCKLIWGFAPIEVEMYEFAPRDEVIRHSVLGVSDWVTNTSDIEKMLSPPLGMEMINGHDSQKFNQEVDDIVNNWLHIFVPRFYSKSEDEFPKRLLSLMADFCRSPAEEVCHTPSSTTDEYPISGVFPLQTVSPSTSADHPQTKLLRDVFRLLIVTYCLSHAVTIAESRRMNTLSQMQCANKHMYQKHCGPKLANRQLKHIFSTLRDRLMERILKQLSQYLKSSRRHERWTAAFCAILGLAVAHEQSQQLIHLILATEVDEGNISPHEAKRVGEQACEVIDERFDFIAKLFRLKYHQKFNPLRDRTKPGMREQLGERAFDFINAVANVTAAKGEFLRERARERISSDNQLKYTARLQASFLLSFWPPT